jgi:hypothetical protein
MGADDFFVGVGLQKTVCAEQVYATVWHVVGGNLEKSK